MKKLAFVVLLIIVFNVFGQPASGGARYLILCRDVYRPSLEELAEWKTQKGVETYIASLDDIGLSSTSVRNYIIDAYETWDPAPEYVLLASSANELEMIYGGRTMYGAFDSDWKYGELTGDIYNDVLVGRFPARNSDDMQEIVNKVLRYEQNPLDGDWLHKGTVMVIEDGDDDDSLYWANCDTAMAAMRRNGYTHIDSFSSYGGDDRYDVESAINDGRGLILFRGQSTTSWWPPFNIEFSHMTNTYMTPIVLSITCHTISDGGSAEAGTWWLTEGTPDNPKGGVAFQGTTTSISHGGHLRGETAEGILQSFYSDTTNDLGRTAEAGRINQFSQYGDTAQYTGHILLGDPEMDIRTMPPRTMTVSAPATIPIGDITFSVELSYEGTPVVNGLVCVMGDDIYEYGYTNDAGIVELSVSSSEESEMTITSTAKNFLPEVGTIPILASGAYVVVDDYTIDDSEYGNDDGKLNPGERVSLELTLRNAGPETAHSVNSTLLIDDSFITIHDDAADVGDLTSESTSTAIFDVEVNSTTPYDYFFNFSTEITATEGTWTSSTPNISLTTPDIEISSITIDDSAPYGNGNGELEAGEGAFIGIEFENINESGLSISSIDLHAFSTELFFEDSTDSIESVPALDIFTSTSEGIFISVSPSLLYTPSATIEIELIGDGLTYTYYDTLSFVLDFLVGGGAYIGPDDYGYFCYSDEDIASGRAPVYEWVEINEEVEPLDPISDEDDDTESYSLSHEIMFYGETYDRLSICSNGFVAPGNQDWASGGYGHEQHIPHVGEVAGIMAMFWRDLNPRRSGDIYGRYDSEINAFVIEFDGIQHYGSWDTEEKFELLLRNPEYYPTPTGDWEILMQYHTVADASDNAIGIESPDETTGIEYVYHNDYHTFAAEIEDHRAILFTTNPPVSPDNLWIVRENYSIDDEVGGNDNGLLETGESVNLQLTLKNIGAIDASNVSVTITTTDDFVTIEDSEAFFGDITASASSTNETDILSFTVESDITDDDEVHIIITITADDGYERVSNLKIPLHIGLNTYVYDFDAGWNLASYPFEGTGNLESMYPGAIDRQYVFDTPTSDYDVTTTIEAGIGFWVLYSASEIINYSVESAWIRSLDIDLLPGWNLVGTISSPVPVTELETSASIVFPVYGYNSSGYFEADTLFPGRGYWILTTDSEEISLP